jgi:negative regulator of flagellin synthesis FlgM
VKIDKTGKSLPSGPTGEAAARAPAKGKTSAPASSQPASTSVSLGSTATQLSSLESTIQNAPVVDAKKVAEIKQAISDGRFQINSGVVADQLIKTVRDLIASRN